MVHVAARVEHVAGLQLARPDRLRGAVGEGCLNCHAGRANAIDGSQHKMKVIEAAISAAPPWSRFAARRTATRRETLPARKPGARSHDRQPGAAIAATGRIDLPAVPPPADGGGSRPGTHIRRFPSRPAARRRPPGLPSGVEQHADDGGGTRGTTPYEPVLSTLGDPDVRHLSRPPRRTESRATSDYYRTACLKCHQTPHRECTVAVAKCNKESPENDCVHCQMPCSPTEIPHLAFTHHRIAVHDRPSAAPAWDPVLVPFTDLSRFSEIDRQRCSASAIWKPRTGSGTCSRHCLNALVRSSC